MLIYYSITSFELLERKLTSAEKNEIVETFYRIGKRMNMTDLPNNYSEWSLKYTIHLEENLENSSHTKDLFRQYRKHLGAFRYFVLLEIQRILLSARVNNLLELGAPRLANRFVYLYKLTRRSGLNKLLINAMVPKKFRNQVRSLDKAPNHLQACPYHKK